MNAADDFLRDAIALFRKHREMAEKALRQIDDEMFFRRPGAHVNNLAIIVKHLAGNLRSRWTHFLTTDGEKPDRNRNGEFVLGPADTRAALMASWDRGWQILFQALGSLTANDLTRLVAIRGEPHTVVQALNRAMTHAAYHVGQITYLCRMMKPDGWQWITVPPRGS